MQVALHEEIGKPKILPETMCSLCINALQKGMKRSLLPANISKTIEQTGLCSLVWQPYKCRFYYLYKSFTHNGY